MSATAKTPTALPSGAATSRARRARRAARAGIVAGPLFLGGVVLLTWWEHDYLHSVGWTVLDDNDVPWPSGLALAEHGWVQVLNFAVTGLLLLFFVRALRLELPARFSARVASALLTVMAVALTAAAAPTDRDFTSAPSTWHGWTHGISFIVIVLCSVLAPLFTGRALRGEARWRPLAAASAAVGLVCAVSLFLPSQVGFYLFLVTLFGWLTALAARFARLTAGVTSG